MSRRQKPPGMENWTWDEINSGRKMSKGEKRSHRLAVTLGASKSPKGEIQPPDFADNPTYHFVFIGLILCGLIGVVVTLLASK